MIRRTMFAGAALAAMLGGLFIAANRSLSELGGYFRATADTTVENLTGQIPEAIHDRKMEQELQAARQQLIDRQVELNLSRSQVEQLQKDVQKLEGSLARRQRLLAEAYPVMKEAVDQDRPKLRFASTEFSMADFQKELDDMHGCHLLLGHRGRRTDDLEPDPRRHRAIGV